MRTVRETEDEFQFIVVGGGSAGCLVARQLAAAQAGSVALIEAGPESRDVRSAVPNWYPRTFGSRLDWNYATEPQAGLGGRRIAWPRGKLLGGSGAINALIYLQAASTDFQRWGWSWADDFIQLPLLQCSPPPAPHPWSLAFVDAAVDYGLQAVANFSQSQANSCGLFSVAQHGGLRQHTGQQLDQLPGLHLITNCHAERIELKNHRAVAVHLRTADGRARIVQARQEIVLCGGVLGSPMLLWQSGIGSGPQLRELGIACQVDLPAVGSNLQDHLVFPVVFETNTASGLPRRPNRQARQQFRQHGNGPLTSNIAEAGALVAAERSAGQPGYDGDDATTAQVQIHFTPTHYLKYPRLASGDCHFSLAVTDLHPRSRGELRPRPGATGARLDVAIAPNYLQAPEDTERMRKAIAIARELARQPSLSRWIVSETLPGPRRADSRSLNKVLQAFAQSIYHPVGTCRMQSPLAPEVAATVVDSQFRVHGIKGLRIADASVLPDLPSGNTNAVTLLAAARLAALLMDVDPGAGPV